MNTKPQVSIIVPCYNRATIVGPAIDSVRNQTFSDWELVIVDDGSSDDLEQVIRSYEDPKIRIVRHEVNRGEPTARNTGIQSAMGRFIAFLDSDDLWLPQKLERQVELVLKARDPENVFCVTRTLVVLSGGRRIVRPRLGPAPGRSFGEYLYNDGGFAQSSSFFLAKSLAARFPFREDLRQMVDQLFFIEIGAAGAEYLLVPEVLTVWNNEERLDRLTMADDLEKWEAIMKSFAEHAQGLVPQHAMLAAEARFLSGHLWKVSPHRSLNLLWKAYRGGALSASQGAFLLCRNALPPKAYNTLRDWLSAATAGRNGGDGQTQELHKGS